MEFIQNFFDLPISIVENLETIPQPLKHGNIGTPTWSPNNNGCLSTKSCYKMINGTHTSEYDFKWIWKLHCPNKISHLVMPQQ